MDTPEQFGRYKVERLLGEGAMGKVYLAYDPVLQRRLAVKLISIAPQLNEKTRTEYLTRFSLEAKASARLNHQSIVTVYDAGDEGGLPWIAFQYVDGESLEHLLQRETRLPLETAMSIAGDIAGALRCAHSYGIVHRDIKPANILIDTVTGVAKLADFGVAKAPRAVLTQEGKTVGSPGYMSPEQIDGSDLDERSDIFSLGVVLYEMIAGGHPFVRDTVATTVYATLSGSFASLRTQLPEIPEALDRMVAGCLMPEREQRLRSADDFLEALRGFEASPRRGEPRSSTAGLTPREPEVKGRSTGARRRLAALRDRITAFRRCHGSLDKCINLVASGYASIRPHGSAFGAWCRRKLAWAWARGAPFIVPSYQTARRGWERDRRLRIAFRAAAVVCAAGVALALFFPRGDSGAVAPVLSFTTVSLSREQRALADSCRYLLEEKELYHAEKPAHRLIDRGGVAAANGYLLRGRIALENEEYSAAKDAFTEALELPGGRALLRKEENALLRQLKEILSRERTDELLVSLVAHTLGLGESEEVRRWTSHVHYWLRWNTVRIREAAGEDVDMVQMYILDMNHAGSVSTRVRAARKLGELGDKKAVPALKKARDKGIRAPFVAATASSVLQEHFGE